MHEMGIALEVMRLAREEAEAAGAGRVVGLKLRVGRWSGVEVESLRFALEALGDGTEFEGVTVEVERVEPTFRCAACAESYPGSGFFDPCPHCGTPGGELLAGDEMTLAEIDVEEG